MPYVQLPDDTANNGKRVANVIDGTGQYVQETVLADTTGTPFNAATAAAQTAGNASLSNIDTDLGAKADASATTDAGVFSLIALVKRLLGKVTAVDTGNVTIVSSSLPTGAATGAKQDTGNTSVTSIDTKTPALGQAVSASSVPVVLPAAQITTLTPPAAITGFATSAGQTTGNTSVANLDTNLGAKADTSAATDTGSFSLIALIKRLLTKIPVLGSATSANSLPVVIASDQGAVTVSTHAVTQSGTWTVQPGNTANTTAWKVDGSAVTQPVSAASLPLPTGAATAAKQPALGTAGTASVDVITVQGKASMTPVLTDGSAATQPVSGTVTANIGTVATLATAANQSTGNTSLANLDTDLGAKADTSATTDTGTFSLIALIKRLTSKIPAVGSATSANSLPVVIASDQGAVTVGTHGVTQSGTWTVQPGNTANTTAWKVDGSAVTQPISGTVTVNAGTNLNTSALALETGGNLATVAGAVTSARVQTLESSGLIPKIFDYLSYASASTTDTYVYKAGGSGGSTVATLTVTWTDSTKTVLSTVART